MPRWSLGFPKTKTAIFIINWNKTKNRIILDVFSIGAISSTTVMYCHWVWLLQLMSLYYITFYCIDSVILLENRPLVKFIRNYIRNSSGVFFISPLGEDIEDVISRFYTCIVVCAKILFYKMKRKNYAGVWRKEFYFLVVKNNILLTRGALSQNIVFTTRK